MERTFASSLLERGKRQFRLTREGQAVYDSGKQIIQTYESLFRALQKLKEIISGTIRLSTISSIGLHDLPLYLKPFLQSHPRANVRVEYRRAPQVYEDVISNVADLGLVAYPAPNVALETVVLRQDPLVLICHPKHPLATARRVKLKKLTGAKFIGFDSRLPTGKAIKQALQRRHVQVVPALEFDNIETIKQAVEIDAGVALAPRSTITQELAKGTLAEVAITDADLARPLAVIYKKSRVLTPTMKEFIAALKGEPGK
jgi:LysR family transcriptional regulator, transcriptional activator of the cysJI operon